MASYGRHENQRSTLALITAGFHEFSRTSAAYIARVPLAHRLVALGTLIASTVLIGSIKLSRQTMATQGNFKSKEDGLFQKFKKWKVVKKSLSAVDCLLSIMENFIIPSTKPADNKQSPKPNGKVVTESSLSTFQEMNGLPKLLNLRHISNSSNNSGTPHNNPKPSADTEDWTPFSSVSAVDESVFDRSCVSLMEDLSQSTISTPIRDLRQQMASKIRTWRLAIRDIEGSPEFPTWSPDTSRGMKKPKFLTRLWNSLVGWLPSRLARSDYSSVPGSGRKRKRLDGDDDDLALYIPHHKGLSKLNGRSNQLGTDAAESTATPTIRGLSVVPIIGNWFSAEIPTQPQEDDDTSELQLDHISLIQRDFTSPSKQASDSTSDTEPYEILEMEGKTTQEYSEPT